MTRNATRLHSCFRLLTVCCLIAAGITLQTEEVMEMVDDLFEEIEGARTGRRLSQEDFTPMYELPQSKPVLPSYVNFDEEPAAPAGDTLPTGVNQVTQPAAGFGPLPDPNTPDPSKPQQYQIEQVMVALLNQISQALQYIIQGIDYIARTKEYDNEEAQQYLKRFKGQLEDSLIDLALAARQSYPERFVSINGTEFWSAEVVPTLKSQDPGCRGGGYRRLLVMNAATHVREDELFVDRCMPGSAFSSHELGTVIGLLAMTKGVAMANNATRRIIVLSQPDYGYNMIPETVDNGVADVLMTISQQVANTVTLMSRLFYSSGRRLLIESEFAVASAAANPGALPNGAATGGAATTEVAAPSTTSVFELTAGANTKSGMALCKDIPWMKVESADVVDLGKCDWITLWTDMQDEAKSFAELMTKVKSTVDSLWGSISCEAMKETQGRVLEQLRSAYPMKPCSTLGCNKCVMPRLSAKEAGTDIVVTGCIVDPSGDRKSQQWEFIYARGEQSDIYQIKSLSSNLCINAPRGISKNGFVVLGPCSEEGTTNNIFRVLQLDSSPQFPDERFLIVHLDSKMCMGIEPSSQRLALGVCKCNVAQMFKGMDRQ